MPFFVSYASLGEHFHVAPRAVSYPLSEIYEGMEIARNLKKSMRENEIAISEILFPMEVNLKSNEAEIQKACWPQP